MKYIIDGVVKEMSEEYDNFTVVPLTSKIPSLQFIDRFTEAEQLAAISAGPAAMRLFLRAAAAQEVDLAHQETIRGVRALAAAGIIAPGRADEILVP